MLGFKKQHASSIFHSCLKKERKTNEKSNESSILKNACENFLDLCFKERIKQKGNRSATIRPVTIKVTLLNFKEKKIL